MLRLACGILLVALLAVGCGSDPAPAGTGGVGGAPIEPGPTCLAFCANIVGNCRAFPQNEADCRLSCQALIDDGRAESEACAEAYEAGFACVAELECVDVTAWLDGVENPCQELNDEIEVACP